MKKDTLQHSFCSSFFFVLYSMRVFLVTLFLQWVWGDNPTLGNTFLAIRSLFQLPFFSPPSSMAPVYQLWAWSGSLLTSSTLAPPFLDPVGKLAEPRIHESAMAFLSPSPAPFFHVLSHAWSHLQVSLPSTFSLGVRQPATQVPSPCLSIIFYAC